MNRTVEKETVNIKGSSLNEVQVHIDHFHKLAQRFLLSEARQFLEHEDLRLSKEDRRVILRKVEAAFKNNILDLTSITSVRRGSLVFDIVLTHAAFVSIVGAFYLFNRTIGNPLSESIKKTRSSRRRVDHHV